MATYPSARYRWFFTSPGIFSVLTSKYNYLPVYIFFPKNIDPTNPFVFSLHKKAAFASPAAEHNHINLNGAMSIHVN